MPVVGDKKLFAIEWRIEGQEGGYTFANFCFWINGSQVGDFDDVVILYSTVTYLEAFLDRYESRSIDSLCDRPKEEIFREIYDSYVFTVAPGEVMHEKRPKPDDDNQRNYGRSSQLRNSFHLDDVGESSFRDSISIILFNDKVRNSQRMIWRTLEDMSLHEAELPEDYFDKVAKEFLAQVRASGFEK